MKAFELKNFYSNGIDRLAAKGRVKSGIYEKDIQKYIDGLIWSKAIKRLSQNFRYNKDNSMFSCHLPFNGKIYYVAYSYKTKEVTYMQMP